MFKIVIASKVKKSVGGMCVCHVRGQYRRVGDRVKIREKDGDLF